MGISFFLAPAFFAGIFWRIFVKWRSYGAEGPSDEYILGYRVGGGNNRRNHHDIAAFLLFSGLSHSRPYILRRLAQYAAADSGPIK